MAATQVVTVLVAMETVLEMVTLPAGQAIPVLPVTMDATAPWEERARSALLGCNSGHTKKYANPTRSFSAARWCITFTCNILHKE